MLVVLLLVKVKTKPIIASDIPAIHMHTRDLVFLESRQMAVIKAEG